jgi:hypothetical protein
MQMKINFVLRRRVFVGLEWQTKPTYVAGTSRRTAFTSLTTSGCPKKVTDESWRSRISHHTSFAPAMQDQDFLDITTPPPTTAPDHPTAVQRQIEPGFKALISNATSSNQTVAEQSQSASGATAPLPTTDSASTTAMRHPANTGATTLPPTLTPTHSATPDENPPAYFLALLPPIPEEAAGEYEDDPRDVQSSKGNQIPTCGSAESPEVAPISDSIPEASTISTKRTTGLDNDEAAGPLQDFTSPALPPEFNVRLSSNLGLLPGDAKATLFGG